MTRRSSAMIAGFALALTLGVTLVRADGLIVIDRPFPVPPGHATFAPLSVKYHHVTVRIANQVATTEIDQVFFNPNGQRLEGTYLFPIPKNAQIEKLLMDVNGRMTEAELLDAARARSIYEDIVRRLRDPALLEYAGQGLFRLRVFPIEPHSEKRIRLRYSQVLSSDAGIVEYRYPLNTEKFSSQPLEDVSIDVTIDTTEPLKSIYSPSHEVEIARHGARRAVIGYEAKGVTPEADFQLFYSTHPASEIGLSLLTFRDPSEREGGYFVLLASPPVEADSRRVVQKDVVFVLDTSGSMAEGGKLDQAKRALRFCLANLNPGDRFELVRFSTESEPLFAGLVAADEAHRAQAEQFIQDLRPIGGTAIEEALGTALAPAASVGQRDRPYVVVFLTDGRPTVGATREDEILAKVAKTLGDRAVRIFSFGIGTDVNTHLLDELAERTRAVSQYVLPKEDIEVKVSSFFSKITYPVLANPKLEVSGGDVRLGKVYPRPLPDLFRGEQLVVAGRYTGSGEAALTISGTVNGVARRFAEKVAFPQRSRDHAFIPRLWATRRVGFLLDQIRLHGESAELKTEITELARRYGIVTPYTAYLIVEDEVGRSVPVTSRTLQGIERDAAVRAEAHRQYSEVNAAKSGEGAVGGAMAYERLKRAETAAAPAAANAAAQRALTGAVAAGGARLQDALQMQRNRFVGGRTFYQNGNQWIDAAVQERPSARHVQVKFNSAEYFDLLRREPASAQWLALGRNVTFQMGDAVYEVVE